MNVTVRHVAPAVRRRVHHSPNMYERATTILEARIGAAAMR